MKVLIRSRVLRFTLLLIRDTLSLERTEVQLLDHKEISPAYYLHIQVFKFVFNRLLAVDREFQKELNDTMHDLQMKLDELESQNKKCAHEEKELRKSNENLSCEKVLCFLKLITSRKN